MDDLAIRPVEHWVYRFGMMLTLSAVVAIMGLELNSAAIVIGAMLLAPLMQPVLATGACLSMALFGKALGAMTKVILATAWVIFLAWLIARFLPEREFTTEVLSRTKPDIRDLVVAMAAGTGGAYATVRADASASLPGVAVAVALVPPLAAIGITMEAGDSDRALGALLLYTTNLVAIIMVSIVVFVATGFVPPRRLATTLPRLAMASVAIAALAIAIAYPLYGAAQSTIKANNDLADAEAIVDNWLGDVALQRTVRFENGLLSVELQGFEAPVNQGEVEAALAERFPELEQVPLVYWIRTDRATTTTTAGPTPDEALRAEIESEVRAWLDESGIDYRLENVIVLNGVIRIDAAGAGDPPSVALLSERLVDLVDGLTPRLNWTHLETIEPGDDVVSPFELVAEAVQFEVRQWAQFRGLTARSIEYDGDLLTVEVAGPREPTPAGLGRLEEIVGQVDDDGFELELFYTQRIEITTTTIRPTTTSTLPSTTSTPTSATGSATT